MNVNGDAYIIKEWNGQTILAVTDGLGHGQEASIASGKAREYILHNYADDVEQVVRNLHAHLHGTRGVAAGLAKIGRGNRRLLFCGIGNIEVRVVGEPPMHPASLDGILGLNLRKALKFQYQYSVLRSVILHSDGISGRFELSDYPTIHERPQEVAERILVESGKQDDDATIIIAVEDPDDVDQEHKRD